MDETNRPKSKINGINEQTKIVWMGDTTWMNVWNKPTKKLNEWVTKSGINERTKFVWMGDTTWMNRRNKQTKMLNEWVTQSGINEWTKQMAEKSDS